MARLLLGLLIGLGAGRPPAFQAQEAPLPPRPPHSGLPGGPLPDTLPRATLRAVLRGEPALTLLMWTLAGSDWEKKRRVVYRTRDPGRNSSMPVPSRAAVIT